MAKDIEIPAHIRRLLKDIQTRLNDADSLAAVLGDLYESIERIEAELVNVRRLAKYVKKFSKKKEN